MTYLFHSTKITHYLHKPTFTQEDRTVSRSVLNLLFVERSCHFLGTDEETENRDSDSDSDSDAPDIKDAMMANRINKKTRKRQRWLENIKRKAKKAKRSEKAPSFNFSALHLIHDPQTMAEKLLKRLGTLNERFEIKLMILNLISRLIGVHQLMVFNFYPVIIRYICVYHCHTSTSLHCAMSYVYCGITRNYSLIQPVI